MKNKPEILSPAGNIKSIIAAINGGADAVYFGGKSFNARQNAGNMTNEEIKEAVELCHSQGVKVYVTLNILIKNKEIEELVAFLNFLKDLEIDGLIVQDIGIIYLIQKYFPEFKLQTSTQASVYGLEGVLFFERLGFTRVVLPREMSLKEVSKIKKKVKTELKIFCHGALCFAYSGQCLMSSMIGGRSGNRGLCAQPCRKIYELQVKGESSDKDENKFSGYLLSPKDLNTLEKLEDIVESGIDSLKIEGRMKTPEYVYGITKAYREKIDGIVEGKTEQTMNSMDVMQVFNRDFTSGHLLDDTDILNTQVGKNRGILIGKVISLPSSAFNGSHKGYPHLGIELSPEGRISLGDGLSFGEDGKIGTKVDGIFTFDGKRLEKAKSKEKVGIPCRHGVKPGTLIYKNLDKPLMDRLKTQGAKPIEGPKDTIDFKIEVKRNLPVKIQGAVNGKKTVLVSEIIPETPLKNPLDEKMIKEQLSKVGGTGFISGKIEIELDENLFLSRGQLNLLRKSVIEALEKSIEKKPENINTAIRRIPLEDELGKNQKNQHCEKKRLSLAFDNLPTIEFIEGLLEECLDELVLPMLPKETKELEAIIEMGKEKGFDLLLAPPRILDTQWSEIMKKEWPKEKLQDLGITGLVIGNYEALNIYQDSEIFLEADQGMNVFNTPAISALTNWGLKSYVLSPELDQDEIREMTENGKLPSVLPVYGAQELMLSKKCVFNCPNKSPKVCKSCHKKMSGDLIDQRGQVFPVERDGMGIIHIYNGDKLFLREEILDLERVKTWRVYHRDESLEFVEKLLSYYNKEIYERNLSLPEGITTQGTTRGSLRRGVK